MRLAILFGFLFLIAGCQPQTTGQLSPTPSQTRTNPTSTRQPPATSTKEAASTRTTPGPESEAEPVIIFNQAGGFAGVDLTWTIFSDGRVLTPDAGVVQVDAESVSDLLATIEETGFFTLTQPKTEPVCCDFFSYTITARAGDQENTLSFSEADPNLPPAFMTSVAAIQEFLPRDLEQY